MYAREIEDRPTKMTPTEINKQPQRRERISTGCKVSITFSGKLRRVRFLIACPFEDTGWEACRDIDNRDDLCDFA